MTCRVQLYFYLLFNTGNSFAFFMRFYFVYGKFAELMKQSFLKFTIFLQICKTIFKKVFSKTA